MAGVDAVQHQTRIATEGPDYKPFEVDVAKVFILIWLVFLSLVFIHFGQLFVPEI